MDWIYASVGERLTRYDMDTDGATLTPQQVVKLPQNVQYAWTHPTERFFYVASSNRLPTGKGGKHWLSAFRVDPATGELEPHGKPLPLPHRPVHMTLDASGAHALVAYNLPSRITVHAIGYDGIIGAEVKQPPDLDTGIFAHQVRVAASNRLAILVTRGNDAAPKQPEDPGALKVFQYQHGVLANLASVAPGQGLGFGPRHLDFHPVKPWVYVAIERQNQLQMFRLEGDGLAQKPAYVKSTLAEPKNVRPRQLVGAIHVHPSGKFVYVSNRNNGNTKIVQGKKVFAGGENSIAVFAIDQTTGEPKLIQHADPQSFHVRTFDIDQEGELLVAASISEMLVLKGKKIVPVPAALSVFSIRPDGKLDFKRKYDVKTSEEKMQWWLG